MALSMMSPNGDSACEGNVALALYNGNPPHGWSILVGLFIKVWAAPMDATFHILDQILLFCVKLLKRLYSALHSARTHVCQKKPMRGPRVELMQLSKAQGRSKSVEDFAIHCLETAETRRKMARDRGSGVVNNPSRTPNKWLGPIP
jgi:hypothetical protein